jgi:hypothetical protein
MQWRSKIAEAPYRHSRGIKRDGLLMGVESEQDHLQSHLSGPRAHRGALESEAKLQPPKVRRPRGCASANAARADVISARVFAQKRCNKQLH